MEAKPAPQAAEAHATSVPPPSFVPLPADFASRPSPGPVDLSYPLPESARPAVPPPPSLPAAEASYRPLPPLANTPLPEPLAALSSASSGTLAALLHNMAQNVSRPNWPAPMPQTGLLPAGMVTLPLAEVMRLVGGTMPDPASPFATFRIAGGASGAR